MAYKTLILIDNSSDMTTLNQQIIKETVKYFLKNADEDNKIAIAVTGENAEYVTDYEDSLNTQLKTIEALDFTEINAPAVDALMEVILDWKDSDLADRDILFIGSRMIAINSDYTEEEFLFEISGKQYPIYTLACNQNDNNAFIKSMNAISRISGGKSISTLDAKSDAGVEKQLFDLIYSQMREERRLSEINNGAENELDEIEETGLGSTDITEENEITEKKSDTDDIIQQYEEEIVNEGFDTESNVIYERSGQNGDNTVALFASSVILIATIGLIFVLSIFVKNKKNKREEESFLKSIKSKGDSIQKGIKNTFDNETYGDTVFLSGDRDEEEGGTTLLYQTVEGMEITLEDRANPSKYFRIHIRDSVIVGRSKKLCDVAISYDDSISSKHCELFIRDSKLYCRDLGSANGTMINQQKVYQELLVESGDILRIGRLSFFVQVIKGQNDD